MSDLTAKEKKLIAALLRYASNEFTNHGCCEFDVAKEAGYTPNESSVLRTRVARHAYGEEGQDADDWKDPSPIHHDWMLMDYFADLLARE